MGAAIVGVTGVLDGAAVLEAERLRVTREDPAVGAVVLAATGAVVVGIGGTTSNSRRSVGVTGVEVVIGCDLAQTGVIGVCVMDGAGVDCEATGGFGVVAVDGWRLEDKGAREVVRSASTGTGVADVAARV